MIWIDRLIVLHIAIPPLKILDHLVLILSHIIQTTIRVSGTKVLMMRRHHPTWITGHLVSSTHWVCHLDLALMSGRLLVEVFHLGVVRGVIILTVVVVRRRVMTIGIPMERIIPFMLITQRRITRWSNRRTWRRYHTTRITPKWSQVTVYPVWSYLWAFFLDRWRHARWGCWNCRGRIVWHAGSRWG